MVSVPLIIAAILLLLVIIFIVKKLFKLAAIVGAVALGVFLGLKLLEWVG